MRLKSLELQGYKTFASRTLFEFADTVTAIVGPNGSGKSNIADSLRWVLGEQSYALLRGKKTEDMIFAGSEHRARAGMASASVVFDNSDGWLPIDFTEVAITRRAYRDGTNEYLVNGQKVRLKDVSELLSQSGLAERTYTIIGQGLVDAALALKAEERRRLFEEAAGIGLHRARREEALRRLDTTRRNLDRVQDILAELQPRLRSLERQARRAREYDQVKADLRVLLHEWYGFHWHRAQKDLAMAKEAARVQEASLNRARQAATALDEQLATLRERIGSLRARLNSWHRQSAKVHTEREELSRQRAVTDERIRSLHEQASALQSEMARLQEDRGLREAAYLAAAGEVERLSAELEETREQAAQARQALNQRQTEREDAERLLQSARQSLSELNDRQSQLQARQAERQSQAERQGKALEAAGLAVQAAQNELESAQARLGVAEKAQVEAETARRRLEETLQAHRQKMAAVEATRREMQERRGAHAAEIARLQAQLGVLQEAEIALSGYGAGAQALLKAARQSQLRGARGALSASLDMPPEIEIAIAAALGDYLDAVLLESGPDEALDLLEGQGTRAALLPLDLLRPFHFNYSYSAKPEGDAEDGVLGVAANLVNSPPDLRPAIDVLLGQVWVVRDRRSARRFLRRLEDAVPAARAVTLRGEIFHASGPIQAGAAGKGALGRPRQLRELAATLQEAQEQAGSIADQAREVDRELEALGIEEKRLSEALRQARRQEETAAQAANREKLSVEAARRQSRWQVEQCDRLEADLKRGEVEGAALLEELGQLEGRLSSAREQVRQASQQLGELTLDEFQSQLTHWNTLVAVVERALGAGRHRQSEQGAILERSQQALDRARERQYKLAGLLVELENGKSAQRGAESRVNEAIDALQALIEPAESELETAERDQEKLQADAAAARQTLSLAEHQFAQVRITQARSQEGFDSLQRRIEEDFGLVAFDYDEEVSGQTPLPLAGMVEELPRVTKLTPDLEENLKRQRAQLRRIGPVNPEAQAEYLEVKDRFAFLNNQVADLEKAEIDVRKVIGELDELMQREFQKTFDAVAEEFKSIFTRLFGGGSAHLVLTDPGDLTDTGIDIEARLPGRRTQGLSLLSGGERSLTAVSLVFALLKVSPTPFCVLDEVDAMLDEANVGRFRELLRELSANTQFVVVTHNRNTVQVADVIYGITMGRDSASQTISLKLDEVSQVVN